MQNTLPSHRSLTSSMCSSAIVAVAGLLINCSRSSPSSSANTSPENSSASSQILFFMKNWPRLVSDRMPPENVQDGAAGRSRTGDLRITNALLYQLSYSGVGAHYTAAPIPRANPISGSAIPENGFALFYESRHPLLLVLDRKTGVKQTSLEAHAFGECRFERAIDRFFGHHDHRQGQFANLVRRVQHFRHQLCQRNDAAYKTNPFCFGHVHEARLA